MFAFRKKMITSVWQRYAKLCDPSRAEWRKQGSSEMIRKIARAVAKQKFFSKDTSDAPSRFIAGIFLIGMSICAEQASALTMEQAVENCRATVGKPIVQACMQAQGKGGNLEACRAQATPKVRACVQSALNAANGRANV